MHPNVHSSTISNGQVLEATQVPIRKRVDQKIMVRLPNGILRSREKEGAPTLATAWMDLERIMLSELSQALKDKYHMISPTSGQPNKQAGKT